MLIIVCDVFSEVECPLLENTWQELKEFIQQDFKEVHVAKFDCTVYRPICTGIGVYEYPCIVWMKNGRIKERFHCRHDTESMKSFIFEMMQAKNAPNIDDGVSKIDEEELPRLDVNDFVDIPGGGDVVEVSISKAGKGKDSSENPSLVSEEHLEVNDADQGPDVNEANFDKAPKIISTRNESVDLDYNSTTNVSDSNVKAEFIDDSIDTSKNGTSSEIEADSLETNLTESSSKARDEDKLEIAEAVKAIDSNTGTRNDADDFVKVSNEKFSEPATTNSKEPSSNSSDGSTDQLKVEVKSHFIKMNSDEDSESLADPATSDSEDFSPENSTKLTQVIDSNS